MKRLLVIALYLISTSAAAQSLTIRFFDVGQGDAVLISEGGKHALVDAGPGAAILQHLATVGIDTIDLLVASHNHADHIGGMSAVFGAHVVRYYMDNGVSHTTATYQRTIAALRRSGAQYLQATSRTITLGDAQLRILAAPPGATGHNNSSVGIIVEYGNFKALLTGDSETLELTHWLNTGVVPRVQVVKAAHHGSHNGATMQWIEATRPGVVVISVGSQNSYGHPAAAVITAWESVGARVHRTDRDGSVVVTGTPDGNFSVSTMTFVAGPTVPAAGIDSMKTVTSPACCRVCTKGKACGNSCINRQYQCRQPPGCACNARP